MRGRDIVELASQSCPPRRARSAAPRAMVLPWKRVGEDNWSPAMKVDGGRPGGTSMTRFSTAAVLAHQDDQRAARPEAHEFDMLQPRVDLRRHDHAGAVRQAGEQRRRLAQHVFDAGAGGSPAAICASMRARSSVGDRPDLHQRIDEEAQALPGSACGRHWCAARRSAPRPRGPS